MLGEVNKGMIGDVESLHHSDFILVAQQNQQFIIRTVLELDNQLILVVVGRLLEVEFE